MLCISFQTAAKSIIEGSFVSSHFWDELPFGFWKINIKNRLQSDTTTILDAKITFHGTHSQDSLRFEHINKCEEIPFPEEPKKTTEQPVEKSSTIPSHSLIIAIVVSIVVVVPLVVAIIILYKKIKSSTNNENQGYSPPPRFELITRHNHVGEHL